MVRGSIPVFSITALIGIAARSSGDRKSTRLNSSHSSISYAVFCLKNVAAPTKICTLSLHDALPIFHRLARHLDRQPREQRGHPRHVAVVLAGLIGAPQNHVVDGARIDSGLLDHGPDRYRGEIVGRSEERRVGKERRSRGSREY